MPNEIVPSNMPADLPDFLRQDLLPEGTINPDFGAVRARDIELPRIILMQALSPSVQDGTFRAGDLVISTTMSLLAEGARGPMPDRPAQNAQRIKFAIAKHYLHWIEWKLRSAGGGMAASSVDPDGDLAKRCEAGEKIKDEKGNEIAAITEYHNFVIVTESSDFPLLLCCGKTNWKHGKNLLSRAILRGQQFPIQAGRYTLASKDEKNRTGQIYKAFSFDNDGWADKALYERAKKVAEMLRGKEIRASVEEDEGAVPETTL